MSVCGNDDMNLNTRNPEIRMEGSDRTSPDGMARRRQQSNQTIEYNHHVQMSSIDETIKQLDDMKENLIKNSVRCHMLEVDLATQFSPFMVDTLRNVKEKCEKCTLQMKLDDATSTKSLPPEGSA